jgi:hypothetical protein
LGIEWLAGEEVDVVEDGLKPNPSKHHHETWHVLHRRSATLNRSTAARVTAAAITKVGGLPATAAAVLPELHHDC